MEMKFKVVLCYEAYVLQGLDLRGELGLHPGGTREAPQSLRKLVGP